MNELTELIAALSTPFVAVVAAAVGIPWMSKIVKAHDKRVDEHAGRLDGQEELLRETIKESARTGEVLVRIEHAIEAQGGTIKAQGANMEKHIDKLRETIKAQGDKQDKQFAKLSGDIAALSERVARIEGPAAR